MMTHRSTIARSSSSSIMSLSIGIVTVALCIVSLCGVFASAATTATSAAPAPTPAPAPVLIFSDEFTELNNEIWEHEITLGGGGNWEFEYYTNNRSNSFVRDGVLFLKPTLTSDTTGDASGMTPLSLWGSSPADQCTGAAFYGCERVPAASNNVINPIQSARIRSSNSFNFKYGRVEVRAKLPKGDWIWPAIWMLPRFNSYGQWPASGEIDIMESRGNGPSYPNGGYNQYSSTMHWGPDYFNNKWPLTTASLQNKTDLHAEFHTFGLNWSADGIYTYLDHDSNRVLNITTGSQSYWQRGNLQSKNINNPWAQRPNNAPFDQKFYLVFNVAVGGTSNYFPDGVGNKSWSNTNGNAMNAFWAAKKTWINTWVGDDVAMQIDWVRVYDH